MDINIPIRPQGMGPAPLFLLLGLVILWINPFWKLDIKGRDKIDESMAYVAVSNHQSMLDIPLLHSLFFHFKWVSKKENLYLPLIGWNMILNRYVIIDRTSKRSTLKMMRECRNYLENGSSIMIFPEGSRSFDGKLRNFKDGAFRLALQTNLPILPIVQDGTWKAVKGKMVINGRTTMKLRVLDPIMPHEFGDRDPGELSKKVRSVMESALNEMRRTCNALRLRVLPGSGSDSRVKPGRPELPPDCQLNPGRPEFPDTLFQTAG
jgi:1-acyl-sn-glycerol-3-phosphate acyltransferase